MKTARYIIVILALSTNIFANSYDIPNDILPNHSISKINTNYNLNLNYKADDKFYHNTTTKNIIQFPNFESLKIYHHKDIISKITYTSTSLENDPNGTQTLASYSEIKTNFQNQFTLLESLEKIATKNSFQKALKSKKTNIISTFYNPKNELYYAVTIIHNKKGPKLLISIYNFYKFNERLARVSGKYGITLDRYLNGYHFTKPTLPNPSQDTPYDNLRVKLNMDENEFYTLYKIKLNEVEMAKKFKWVTVYNTDKITNINSTQVGIHNGKVVAIVLKSKKIKAKTAKELEPTLQHAINYLSNTNNYYVTILHEGPKGFMLPNKIGRKFFDDFACYFSILKNPELSQTSFIYFDSNPFYKPYYTLAMYNDNYKNKVLKKLGRHSPDNTLTGAILNDLIFTPPTPKLPKVPSNF